MEECKTQVARKIMSIANRDEGKGLALLLMQKEFGCTNLNAALRAMAEQIEKEVSEDYVKLPVDAEGVRINPDDRLFGGEANRYDGLTPLMTVTSLLLCRCSDGLAWEVETNRGTFEDLGQLHHYHKQTVEDVLREFTHAILNQKARCRERNIAEYAQKLQLKDD